MCKITTIGSLKPICLCFIQNFTGFLSYLGSGKSLRFLVGVGGVEWSGDILCWFVGVIESYAALNR